VSDGRLSLAFGDPADGTTTESLMQLNQDHHANDSRVRFVFNDRVVSLNLAGSVTFGEIAQTFGELSNLRRGNPVSIDVTLK
jgi:hypothetical protein